MAWLPHSDRYEFSVDFFRETEKALYLGLGSRSEGERDLWVPKSQTEITLRQGSTGIVILPRWLVAKERLWHWAELPGHSLPETPKTVPDLLEGKTEAEIRDLVIGEWGGVVSRLEDGTLHVWTDAEEELAYQETDHTQYHPWHVTPVAA